MVFIGWRHWIVRNSNHFQNKTFGRWIWVKAREEMARSEGEGWDSRYTVHNNPVISLHATGSWWGCRWPASELLWLSRQQSSHSVSMCWYAHASNLWGKTVQNLHCSLNINFQGISTPSGAEYQPTRLWRDLYNAITEAKKVIYIAGERKMNSLCWVGFFWTLMKRMECLPQSKFIERQSRGMGGLCPWRAA